MKRILGKWYFLIGPIIIALLFITGFRDSEINDVIDYSGYQDPPVAVNTDEEIELEDVPLEASVNVAVTETPNAEIDGNKYKIIQVVDGDTIRIEVDGVTESVRIIGMDTPEVVDPRKPVQCFGVEASNQAKKLLAGQTITLEIEESQGARDKYRRLLGYVIMPDGRDFGTIMISTGYAYEYTYNTPYKKQSIYRQAQAEAREAELGLWSPETCSGERDF
jgi:micrococcal nuclease